MQYDLAILEVNALFSDVQNLFVIEEFAMDEWDEFGIMKYVDEGQPISGKFRDYHELQLDMLILNVDDKYLIRQLFYIFQREVERGTFMGHLPRHE